MEPLVLTAMTIGGALAAAGLFAFAFLLARDATAGLVALTAVFVFAALGTQDTVQIAGIYVSPFDAVCTVFATVAVLRWAQQTPSAAQLVWLGLGGLICISLLLGISRFGLQRAGNEARATELVYFWSCAAYFSSFPREELTGRRGVDVVVAGGLALAAIVVVRWGMELAGYEVVARASQVGAAPFRVVHAGETMFLASLVIVLLRVVMSGGASRRTQAFLCLFALQVLLLQHRSAWFAALTGALVLAMLDWAAMRRLIPYVALALVPAALAVAALAIKGMFDGVGEAMSYSVQEEATLQWRIEGWADLLAQWRSGGVLQTLIGQPFGSGFRRYLVAVDLEVDFSPHNSYIAFLLRLGVLGLATVLTAYVLCLRGLLRLRRERVCSGRAAPAGRDDYIDYALAAMAAQLVFFLFYGPHIMQAVFVGVALSQPHRASAPRALATPVVRQGRPA